MKEQYMQDLAKMRKDKNEKQLNRLNIKINPALPALTDDSAAVIRTPEETLRRAVTALFATQIAMDCSNPEADIAESAEFFTDMLKQFGLQNEPTEDEKKFFALTDPEAKAPPKQETVNMAWRVEMVMPLLWALGITKELPYPDKESNFIEEARLIVSCGSFDELMQNVRMRKPSEILDKADLIYRMDWACVDARVNHEKPTGRLNVEVVAEQHKGLNWLIGARDAEDWDKVKPHT